MEAKKDNKFFEIKDPSVVRNIFGLVVRRGLVFTLWVKDQASRYKTRVIFVSPDTKRILVQFLAMQSETPFLRDLRARSTEVVLATFQADSIDFFLKTQFINRTSEGHVELHLPDSIFRLQRRASLRIPLTRDAAPKVTLLDPSVENTQYAALTDGSILAYRMLDLSAGGCALAAPVEDAPKFRRGDSVHDLRFSLRGIPIIAEGTIVHVQKIKNDRGKEILKVGLQFVNLQNQYERHIVVFALDESRKLFSLLY